MRYTTIGRRVVKVKVKSRPAQLQMRTTPYVNEGGTSQATVPPLFGRVPPTSSDRPVRRNWKKMAVLFTAALIPVAIAATGYAFLADSKPSPRERRPSPETRQQSSATQPGITTFSAETPQLRPMGYAGAPRTSTSITASAPGGAGALPGMPAPAGSPSIAGVGLAEHRRTAEARPGDSADDIHRAAFEEGRRLVLPEDATGNCAIANGGIRDLSTCLARTGARAE